MRESILKATITLHPDDRDALLELLEDAEVNGVLTRPFGCRIDEVFLPEEEVEV